MKCPCPCCGYLTIDKLGYWQICQVCYWQDNATQSEQETYEGGPNGISLQLARSNFRIFGASDFIYVDIVRKPFPEEIPEI